MAEGRAADRRDNFDQSFLVDIFPSPIGNLHFSNLESQKLEIDIFQTWKLKDVPRFASNLTSISSTKRV